VEEFKADPYLATLLNCMLWVFYGLPIVHPNSILVVTINGVGLVVEAIYLMIFFIYAPNKKRVRALAKSPISSSLPPGRAIGRQKDCVGWLAFFCT
jgi:hypothetical protein